MSEPQTLQQAILYFSDPTRCREYLIARRWPNGIECPRCGNKNVTFQAKHNRWQCSTHHAKRTFTLKTGTVFEDSPLGLDKWLCAMWMIVSCKNGVSSYEVHRAIGVTQKTAWFMLSRLRLVLQDGRSGGKLGGEVEVDETFIGGKARFMHEDRRKRTIKGRGMSGKAAVMGLLQRHSTKGRSQVRLEVVPNTRRHQLHSRVEKHVEDGSSVFTDALKSYDHLGIYYQHQVIDHAECYAKGNVHTNGMENFWSLLKRAIKGTYVSVEPFHLFRYLDEQAFRFNNRSDSDGERFDTAVASITGKRLTFSELTAANMPQEMVN